MNTSSEQSKSWFQRLRRIVVRNAQRQHVVEPRWTPELQSGEQLELDLRQPTMPSRFRSSLP